MIRLLVSTTCRKTSPEETSGYIHDVNLDTGEVKGSCGIIETSYLGIDPNPRGGLRGAKGIAVRDDQILIANFSSIFRYDPDWRPLGVISHPSCAGIHDIILENDTVWVTSCRNDLLFQFSLNGKVLNFYDLRQPSPALKALKYAPPLQLTSEDIEKGNIDFRDPRTHLFENSCQLHVNGVCFLPGRDILVSCGMLWGRKFSVMFKIKHRLVRMGIWPLLVKANKIILNTLKLKKQMHSELILQPASSRSAVLCLKKSKEHQLLFVVPRTTAPSHSLVAQKDGMVVYLNTSKGEVLHFNPLTGEVLSCTKVTDGFLRGGVNIAEKMLVLGSNDELIVFDLARLKIAQRVSITENKKEFVHAIQILPAHYAHLPQSLETPVSAPDKLLISTGH